MTNRNQFTNRSKKDQPFKWADCSFTTVCPAVRVAWKMYHIIICPIITDVRVTDGQERGLVDHRQPDGTQRFSNQHFTDSAKNQQLLNFMAPNKRTGIKPSVLLENISEIFWKQNIHRASGHRLIPFAVPVQSHVPSFVFKCSQKGFLLIVKTSAGFTVMDQNVTHELHLPLLRIITEKSDAANWLRVY